MEKPKGSTTFLTNDDLMLWMGLLTRDTGTLASRRLQIQDEVVALDFDLAVTLRLFKFDNQKEAANKKFWMRMIGGEKGDDDVLEAATLDDPYADKNTEVW